MYFVILFFWLEFLWTLSWVLPLPSGGLPAILSPRSLPAQSDLFQKGMRWLPERRPSVPKPPHAPLG